MNRAVAVSVVSAALALGSLVLGGLLADFTGAALPRIVYAGGTVALQLQNDGPSQVLFGGCARYSNMAAGDVCQGQVEVSNVGDLDLMYSFSGSVAGDAPGCFGAGFVMTSGDGTIRAFSGEVEVITVTVTLPEDGNPADINLCQGRSATVGVIVVASLTAPLPATVKFSPKSLDKSSGGIPFTVSIKSASGEFAPQDIETATLQLCYDQDGDGKLLEDGECLVNALVGPTTIQKDALTVKFDRARVNGLIADVAPGATVKLVVRGGLTAPAGSTFQGSDTVKVVE